MNMIHELITLLHTHLSPTEVKPLGQIGVFHCHQHQQLHAVPIHQPSMVLVLRGSKRVVLSARDETLQPGQVAFLPAGSELQMENIPCGRSREYLALCLSFAPETIDRFLANYGASLDWAEQRPLFTATAPQAFTRAVKQRVEWCMAGDVDNWIFNDLQQQEILSICGHHRLLGLLLQNRQSSWSQRVSALLSVDLAYKWRISEVGKRLGVSESSLRRSLQEENTSFSELLEQARLVTGLSLLQETSLSVAQVAIMVGYQSQSRFTERFKQRFGMTPSQLKHSRVAVALVD